MLERILEHYKTCPYDFRLKVCKEDPLSEHFEEWVDYYRMKWAIAKALNPSSILEIGVRYGYSARAFLDAAPQAKFVGIDLDLPTFGGSLGAVDWAEQSLRDDGFDASMIKENSQKFKQFPGGIYDLIHVDGQQDGDGTFHDLNLAVTQAHYVLVDGYLWTRDNFLAVNEWVWLNKNVIETATIIPGYSGEFLIKTKLALANSFTADIQSSDAIASAYTADYYLGDCAGWREWQKDKQQLTDPRLKAVAQVGQSIREPAKVVDLGAGRGELSRFFAQAGAEVRAIDYSADAIKLINSAIDEEEIRKRVSVVCASVLDPDAYGAENYDLAVAADIVEHLLPEENDKLYQLVSEKLQAKAGTLVVHTAPNLWNYRYEHALEQKAAKKAGFWLPRTRRTWYERVMHINEQNPRVLRQQLSQHFPHVLLWFANDSSMGGSLLRKFRISDFRKANSIFAIASHSPIDREAIAQLFCMTALHKKDDRNISIELKQDLGSINPGEQFSLPVILTNSTNKILKSLEPYPFHLSYHWLNEKGKVVIFEGLRTPLLTPLNPGEKAEILMTLKAPANPGNYLLSILPVQEGQRWLTKSACNSKMITLKAKSLSSQLEPELR